MSIIYWICFVFGGIFVALSAMGGVDGVDVDPEFNIAPDTSLDLDINVDEARFELGDLEDDITSALNPDSAFEFPEPQLSDQSDRSWLQSAIQFISDILKSFKFWTFGLCFFGATGIVLSQMQVSKVLIFPLAVVMGLLLGVAMASILHVLYNRTVNSIMETSALVGELGTVELPFDASSRGRVRFMVNGMVLDYTAYTDESSSLELGQAVMAVNFDNNKLWVVAADDQSSWFRTIFRAV